MSRKQVGVIYRAFKEGKLENVDKEDMDNVYAYVDRMILILKEENDMR